jgi:hypothetical protein
MPAASALLEIQVWVLRRTVRGLAHEVANLQQMLLLPGPPEGLRAEQDERLARLGDRLAALGREPDEPSEAVALSLSELLDEAVHAHDGLGGEPRVVVHTAPDAAECELLARRESAAAVLLVMLVLAGRARPRLAAGPLHVGSRATDGGVDVEVSADADPARGGGAESEALYAAAVTVARGEGARLERTGAGARVVLRLLAVRPPR